MAITFWGSRLLVGIACSSLLIACDSSDKAAAQRDLAVADNVVLLQQNWDADTREKAWFTSFGSRIMPRSWLLALEQANTQALFNSPAYLESFGFTVPSASAANPDQFAIGMTVTPTRDGHEWVGLGCSGCHSGSVYYQGQRLHIDGGQALIDFQGFEAAAISALAATLSHPKKFARFSSRLKSTDTSALRQEVSNWVESLTRRQTTNRTDIEYGHGRLDAFGQIFNAVAVEALGIESNRHNPNAPVSYPVLWDASHLDLVQWNASAPNAGPGPIIQNVTTAIAVFGHLDIQQKPFDVGYRSSVEMGNLGAIQDAWYQLTAPIWPEGILGPIDQKIAAKGGAIYSENCLACHALSDRNDPKRMLKSTKVNIKEIGTDPTMATNFVGATAQSGAFAGKKMLFAAGPVIGERAPTIQLVAHAAIGALLKEPLSASWQGFLSANSVDDAPIDADPFYYKARPLSGIWAAAPYLHNGSVPTLLDMLSDPADRQPVFPVGKIEFDPAAVGLSHRVLDAKQSSVLDTSIAGNHNGGHRYGTALSSSDKTALIEYLKTL